MHIQDGFGPKKKFEMYCATPELTLLHLMEPARKNAAKYLPPEEMEKLVRFLLDKHTSKSSLLTAIEEIALVTGKHNDFARLLKYFLLKKKMPV